MQLLEPWERASLPLMISVLKSRLRQASWRGLAPSGLTPEQFQALWTLHAHPGLTHGDLAGALGLDKPGTTRVLRGLAAKRLVDVRPDARHGRRQRVHNTEAGEEVVARFTPMRQAIREALEVGFTEEERLQVRGFLGRLLANLEAFEGRGDAHVDR